jgi:hypothetical protein
MDVARFCLSLRFLSSFFFQGIPRTGRIHNHFRQPPTLPEVFDTSRFVSLRRALSLSTLAERAGLSYRMISYAERQTRNPTLDTLLRITAALELT